MTGYQEVITDPSYAGQMICMTYPLQGNYGVRLADGESSRPWARALIVRWACAQPSHHSSEESLDDYLRRWSVPGITDIDTRALTRHLRMQGTLRAVLTHESTRPSELRLQELAEEARRVLPLSEQDLVSETSRTVREDWLEPLPPELKPPAGADGSGLTIAVVDYGVKTNILRSLRERGCRVVVLPHTATWEEIERLGAHGLVLSNGPGDPAVLDRPVQLARAALGRLPLFGICLGHQRPAEQGSDPRIRTDRHRPGGGVRLRGHPGLQGAARGGHHDGARELQPRDDHDRRGCRGPRVSRAADSRRRGARDRARKA